MSRLLIILAAFAAITAAPLVRAVDGVVEINDICVSFGCFSGDAGGFPITITQPGSYRLTSGLTVGSNITAITISADHVTLDLNGFEIRGPVSCSGTPVTSCSSTGTGLGIDINADYVTVENGHLTGLGNACVSATVGNDFVRISDLSISECGDAGIVAVSGRIDNVVVRRVAVDGINSFFGTALVSNSVISGNGSSGQIGGFCSNSVFFSNDNGTICTPLATNNCSSGSSC